MPPETHKQIGRVSSASVFKATGKNWDEWLAILDKAGARSWTRSEIVAFLKKKYKLRPWWQQGVTHGFEVATGRRIDGQNAKGQYTITATKSMPCNVKKVWKLVISKEGKEAWLKPLYEVAVEAGKTFETEDGFFGEIRTLKKDRRIRMTWQDPNWNKNTVVQLTLVDKPNGKSILVIDHSQILDLRIQARLRKRWKDAVSALQQLAELQPPAQGK